MPNVPRELKKKNKVLDVIVSSRTNEDIREYNQEIVKIKGKLIGTNSKILKVLLKLKVYNPHQK